MGKYEAAVLSDGSHVSNFGTPFAFEKIAISNVATALTVATYADARMAYITVESDSIRFRIDGGAPTNAIGHLASAGGAIKLYLNEITNFKTIAANASSIIQVTYSK